MAERRPTFRFRLPWLMTAPRPLPEPQPQSLSQPTTTTLAPRQAFRLTSLPAQPPPLGPQRTESQPSSPRRAPLQFRITSQPTSPSPSEPSFRTTSQPSSPHRAPIKFRVTSQPTSPSPSESSFRTTSQPSSPRRAPIQFRFTSQPTSPSRAGPPFRTTYQPSSPSRVRLQPPPPLVPEPEPEPEPQSPPAGQTSSPPLSPSLPVTQEQPIDPERTQHPPYATEPIPSLSLQEPKPQPPEDLKNQSATETRDEKQVVQDPIKEVKSNGATNEEPQQKKITELGKHTKHGISHLENKKTECESRQKPAQSRKEKPPSHKDVRGDVFKFVQNVITDHSRRGVDKKPASVVTIAGENTGASMRLGSESKGKEGSAPTQRGHKIRTDEPTSEGEGSSGKRRSGDSGTDEDLTTETYVNSNVQSINNSLVLECAVSESDPGVHLVITQDQVEENMISNEEQESIEAHKAEVPAEELIYGPKSPLEEPSASDQVNLL